MNKGLFFSVCGNEMLNAINSYLCAFLWGFRKYISLCNLPRPVISFVVYNIIILVRGVIVVIKDSKDIIPSLPVDFVKHPRPLVFSQVKGIPRSLEAVISI